MEGTNTMNVPPEARICNGNKRSTRCGRTLLKHGGTSRRDQSSFDTSSTWSSAGSPRHTPCSMSRRSTLDTSLGRCSCRCCTPLPALPAFHYVRRVHDACIAICGLTATWMCMTSVRCPECLVHARCATTEACVLSNPHHTCPALLAA